MHAIGNLHNANLLAVATANQGKRVKLHLKRDNRSEVEIVFDDVITFRCDAFLCVHTVSELTEVQPGNVEEWLDQSFGDDAPIMNAVRQMAEAGALRFFELRSSHGASASCLAGRVTITEIKARS